MRQRRHLRRPMLVARTLRQRVLGCGAVLAIAVVATACTVDTAPEPAADSSSRSDATDPTTPDLSAPFAAYADGPIADAAATIREDHGDVDGFAVAVVALDSGYSVSQIVDRPTIDPDGTLPGVAPDGIPLGLFIAAEPQGFRAAPSPPIINAGDLTSVLYDLTLREIHEEATKKLATQVAADLEAARNATAAEEEQAAERIAARADGARVLTIVLLLVAQGYSLEQVIQGIVFGEYEVGGGAACARLSESPAGPRVESLVPECDIVTEISPESTPTNSAVNESVSENEDAKTEFDPDRPRGVYQAALEDFSAQLSPDPTSIVSNLVSIDLDGDVPELALLWVAQLTGSYDMSPDVICVVETRVEIERAPLVGATLVDGQWSGEASISTGTFDGTCAPGSQDNQLETITFTVTFTATDTTLSGTLSGEGITLSFAGTAVS